MNEPVNLNFAKSTVQLPNQLGDIFDNRFDLFFVTNKINRGAAGLSGERSGRDVGRGFWVGCEKILEVGSPKEVCLNLLGEGEGGGQRVRVSILRVCFL